MARSWSLASVALLLCAAAGCSSSDASPASRCGTSTVANGTWVGVEYGGVAGGGWYDPVDEYDPAADYGTGDTSQGDAPAGDTPPGDTSGGDAPPADDGSGGDGSSGWDSADAVTRLHLTSTAPHPDANGCFTCTVGCVTSADGTAGHQALGASETSYADACHAAQFSLEQWSHAMEHQRIQRCQEVATERVPAAPMVRD